MKILNTIVSCLVGFGMWIAVANWLCIALATWIVSMKLSVFMGLMIYGMGALVALAIGAAAGYAALWVTSYTINLLSEWSIWLYKKIKGDKTYEHPQFGRVYDMTGNPLEAAF
jgi:hypothetical protein